MEQNLNSEVSKAKTTPVAALKLLHAVLSGISRNIQQGRIALSDIINDSIDLRVEANTRPTPPPSSPAETETLKRRVYAACRQLVGDGIYGVRIRLADLRSQLRDVPRFELDRTLKDLELAETAALYPLDDPREIRAEDEDAALSTSTGAKRHILYLSRPR